VQRKALALRLRAQNSRAFACRLKPFRGAPAHAQTPIFPVFRAYPIFCRRLLATRVELLTKH
jgi:hypothetical protein